MDFKRLQQAGTMFTSAMGQGLGQIAKGFQEAASGAAFFLAFSVTSGFLPMLMFGALALTLIFLTAKFGDLRKIVPGVFQVLAGSAKMFGAVLTSIIPIATAIGDVLKGIGPMLRGDMEPIKAAITKLRLEFEILWAKLGVGFADVRRGFELIKEGFQPVIDEGIIPIVEAIKAGFGKIADFFLDPIRNLIKGWQQFGTDIVAITAKTIEAVGIEFTSVATFLGASLDQATNAVADFAADFGRGISDIVSIVTGTIEEIANIFTGGMTRIGDSFTTAWSGISVGATGIEGIGRGIAAVTGEITALGGEIFTALGDATAGIRGEVGKIGQSFVDTNKDLFNAFTSSFERIGQSFLNLGNIFTDGVNDFTAYFTVKFQGVIDFATFVFEAIGGVANRAWELAGAGFKKFDELLTVGVEQLQATASRQLGRIGDVFGQIGAQGQAAFDDLMLAVQPLATGLTAIFTSTVQDLDNLVQSGLDSFNSLVDGVKGGFSNIGQAGASLGADLIAIPDRIGTAFANLTGAIGTTLTNEFESAKASGGQLLTALVGTFTGGVEQISTVISGISTSFTSVTEGIASTIENLKTTFASLGETIDGAMGKAFGGVKEKWQKTTGFMGKMMSKTAVDSEETGQQILHNIAENSPGPTQMIRERYAYTAAAVTGSLESIADTAKGIGSGIVAAISPGRIDAAPVYGPMPAPVPEAIKSPISDTHKQLMNSVKGRVGKGADLAGDLLEMAGAKDAANGFKAVAGAIKGVDIALEGAKIAKEVASDFQSLQGIIRGFSAADAAAKIGEMATGLVEAGKAAWGAIMGFGQWIAAKLFQTSVGVTAEATLTTAAVVGATTTTEANMVVAGSNFVVAESFLATAATAVSAWATMLAPLLPIILAVGALGAAIWYVGKIMVDNNFLGFGDLMYGIGNAINSVWSIFTGFFGAIWNGIAAIGQDVWNTFSSALKDIGDTVGMVFTMLAAPFVELFNTIGAAMGGTGKGIDIIGRAVTAILFPLRVVAEILKFAIWSLARTIKMLVIIAGVAIGLILTPFRAAAAVLSFIFKIAGAIFNAFTSVGGAIVGFILNPFQTIVNIVKWIIDAVGGLVNTIGGGLLGTFKAVLSPFSFLGGLFGGDNPAPATDVQQFASGGYVSGAGGPTDDKIPAMLSNGEFVVGADATSRNRSFLEAINGGMAAEQALTLMDIAHPIGDLPDRASVAAGGTAPSVTINNTYQITVNFGDIVLDGATGEEAAADFSRFLQSTEFQLAIQAALTQQVESMR